VCIRWKRGAAGERGVKNLNAGTKRRRAKWKIRHSVRARHSNHRRRLGEGDC